MSSFKLGARSLEELEGVHHELRDIVERAIEISKVDFAVHDGIRTQEEQQALYDSGASKTLNSRHLTGHAVDLVPYVNGKMRWEWEPIYKVANAVQRATIHLRTPIRWGSVWDREIQNLMADLELEVEYYTVRRKRFGKRVFLDGPHFELPQNIYPG